MPNVQYVNRLTEHHEEELTYVTPLRNLVEANNRRTYIALRRPSAKGK